MQPNKFFTFQHADPCFTLNLDILCLVYIRMYKKSQGDANGFEYPLECQSQTASFSLLSGS